MTDMGSIDYDALWKSMSMIYFRSETIPGYKDHFVTFPAVSKNERQYQAIIASIQ